MFSVNNFPHFSLSLSLMVMDSEDNNIVKYAYSDDELIIMRSYLKDFKSMKGPQRKTLLAEKVIPLLKRIPRIAEIKRKGKADWDEYKRVCNS